MRRLLLILLCLLLAAAACSSGSDDDDDGGVATLGGEGADTNGGGDSSVDAEGALLDFSRCMREEGVEEFPDLTPDGNSFTDLLDAGVDLQDDATSEAFETCQPLLEGIVDLDDLDPELLAEAQDNILELVQCMRDKDYDIPDPDFSNGIGLEMFGDLSDLDVDLSSPEFNRAIQQCFVEVGFGFGGGEE